jgi:hypothetical protein
MGLGYPELVGLLVLGIIVAVCYIAYLGLRKPRRSSELTPEQRVADGRLAMSTWHVESWIPVHGAARWTRALLLTVLVLSIFSVFSALDERDELDRRSREGGHGVLYVAPVGSGSPLGPIVPIRFLAIMATGVTFLTWLYRVHKNLPALGGRELKYTPGWAIGWFFVPLLNLIRPLQVMREVWHGSDPAGLERDLAPDGPSTRNQLGTPARVGSWWALFLISVLLGRALDRIGSRGSWRLGELIVLHNLQVLEGLITILAALVAILLVGQVTTWQTERRRLVREFHQELTSEGGGGSA